MSGVLSAVPARFILLALLFVSELILLSLWLDGDRLPVTSSTLAAVQRWGPFVLRYLVGFGAVFVGFSALSFRREIARYAPSGGLPSINGLLLLAHSLAMSAVVWLSSFLYSAQGSASIAWAWMLFGCVAIVTGTLAFVPLRTGKDLLAITGHTWLFAAIVAGAALLLTNPSRALWEPASRLTFNLAVGILQRLLPGTYTQPEIFRIRAPHFGVLIAPECSGLEGIALMLVFATSWLWMFRADFRFPQALLLLPVGALLSYGVNVLRIVVLVLIGNSGYTQIAIGGFHSQAGWIAFNILALAFSATAAYLPFVGRASGIKGSETSHPTQSNPTTAYLVPFLAILACGILASTLTAQFEWLYPIRLLGGAFALYHFRQTYADLNWRISWRGPVAGVLVFALWIAIDKLMSTGAQPIPPQLAAASPMLRGSWIALRALATIITVPIAEELAFRGFLMRRLVSPQFQEATRVTLFAVIGSAIAFGLLHGSRWPAGILAGIVYAMAFGHQRKIGDAVVAHSVTNLLLTFLVLRLENWQYW